MLGLAEQVGPGPAFTTLLSWLRLPVAVFLLMCTVAVVYYAFLNVDQRFRSMLASEVVRVG